MNRISVTMTLLAASAVLAGCSSGGLSSTETASPTQPKLTPTTSRTTATPSEASSTSSGSSDAITPGRITAGSLLLTDRELLSGSWRPYDDTDPDGDADLQSTAPACLHQAEPLKRPELIDRAARAWKWAGGEGVDTISSLSYVYANEEAAKAAFGEYQARVRSCLEWQVSNIFREVQETFSVAVGDQGFGRTISTTAVSDPSIDGGRDYRGIARIGAAVVEIAYYPGPLLDTTSGRARTTELLERSVANR